LLLFDTHKEAKHKTQYIKYILNILNKYKYLNLQPLNIYFGYPDSIG